MQRGVVSEALGRWVVERFRRAGGGGVLGGEVHVNNNNSQQ